MTSLAVILGTGLVGGSVGLALRQSGWDVAGWDPDEKALAVATSRGALGRRLEDPFEELDRADLMVLASPPSQIVETLSDLDTETLVTDVAGVKTPIIQASSHLPHFVGGHPMAGGATSGPTMASSRLFHGAGWALTTDRAEEADLFTMEGIIRSIGANPLRMTATEHDEAVALISHLPHVVAALLMKLGMSDPTAMSLAGGGFRDLTRVAASDTGWWTEILTANTDQLRRVLASFGDALGSMADALDRHDAQAVRAVLDEARAERMRLGEHHTQVRVVLYDRPGEIAKVGHALEATRADVRDFQLRHGEHGGGGILTISVSPGTAETLSGALRDEGFELET